jgi:hypothetical protein
MYVYYIYPAMSKNPNKLPNSLKRTETSVILIVFDGVLYEVLYCYLFLQSLNINQVSGELYLGH